MASTLVSTNGNNSDLFDEPSNSLCSSSIMAILQDIDASMNNAPLPYDDHNNSKNSNAFSFLLSSNELLPSPYSLGTDCINDDMWQESFRIADTDTAASSTVHGLPNNQHKQQDYFYSYDNEDAYLSPNSRPNTDHAEADAVCRLIIKQDLQLQSSVQMSYSQLSSPLVPSSPLTPSPVVSPSSPSMPKTPTTAKKGASKKTAPAVTTTTPSAGGVKKPQRTKKKSSDGSAQPVGKRNKKKKKKNDIVASSGLFSSFELNTDAKRTLNLIAVGIKRKSEVNKKPWDDGVMIFQLGGPTPIPPARLPTTTSATTTIITTTSINNHSGKHQPGS